MAKTQGHGNPDWSRDEVLLALDLYLTCSGSVPGGSDSRVKALSETLRGLSVHPAESRVDSFRNPDGVSFKLQNIRQVASGKGLANVSQVDRDIWAQFGAKPDIVKQLAKDIVSLAGAGTTPPGDAVVYQNGDSGDDDVFMEGRVLTSYHRRRERSRALRKKLIVDRIKKGELACDGCGWTAKHLDEQMAQAGFECHHLVPLHVAGTSETRIKDVALLCATCHRLVHRWIATTGEWLSLTRIGEVVRTNSGEPQN